LTGQRLDLARYGLGAIVGWHLVWAAVAFLWLGYWLRKPLLMPWYEAVQAGDGDRLITRADRIAAAVILAITLIVATGETVLTNIAFPVTIPLTPGVLAYRAGHPPKCGEPPNTKRSREREWLVHNRQAGTPVLLI